MPSNNSGRRISHLRRLFIAAAALAAAIILAGCTSAATENTADETPLEEPIHIAAMKGPTTIGLSQMITDNNPDFDFNIVTAADEITPRLASGDVDIALIPANLAATLYNKDSASVQVIDINTLGVLYAITADEELSSMQDVRMADLEGRTVYMTGKGTVPEYTVQYLLSQSGIPQDSVTVEFRSEPTEVMALISEDPTAVGILPQPYATSAVIQNSDLHNIMDLTEQWDLMIGEEAGSDDAQAEAAAADTDADGFGRLVTGVTVVRTEFANEHPEAVERFLKAHAASVESVLDQPQEYAQTLVDLGIIGNVEVAKEAIPLCNIVCITGEEMEDALSGYLGVLYSYSLESVGGAMPEADFYYIGQ